MSARILHHSLAPRTRWQLSWRPGPGHCLGHGGWCLETKWRTEPTAVSQQHRTKPTELGTHHLAASIAKGGIACGVTARAALWGAGTLASWAGRQDTQPTMQSSPSHRRGHEPQERGPKGNWTPQPPWDKVLCSPPSTGTLSLKITGKATKPLSYKVPASRGSRTTQPWARGAAQHGS